MEIPLPGAAVQPALCPVGGAFSSPDEIFGGAFSRTRKRSHPPALRQRRSASSVQRSQPGWRAGPAPDLRLAVSGQARRGCAAGAFEVLVVAPEVAIGIVGVGI